MDNEQIPSQEQMPHEVRKMVAQNLQGIFEEWLKDQTVPQQETAEIQNLLEVAALDDPEAQNAYNRATTQMLRLGVLTRDDLNGIVNMCEKLGKDIEDKMRREL